MGDYFYGKNEPKDTPKERQLNSTVRRYDELVIYRGHHICNSRTFIDHFPKLFCSSDENECNKLLNNEFLKIKKFKHPERLPRFLMKFQEHIKKIAIKDHYKKQKKKQDE